MGKQVVGEIKNLMPSPLLPMQVTHPELKGCLTCVRVWSFTITLDRIEVHSFQAGGTTWDTPRDATQRVMKNRTPERT